MLSGFRALDLTGTLGMLCGRILGDLGVDVIKVEPPGGDAARRQGPFWHDRLDLDSSLHWLALNANKRGITLNLQDPTGRDLFRRLVERADFVLETFPPGQMEAWGLGYPVLRGWNPRLVHVSLTPFGQTGPYRSYRASDLEVMALSGAMSLAGEPDGEPLRVSFPQTPMWAGSHAAMAALFAHYHRQRTGQGQFVDVSAQVANLSILSHAPAFWDLNRKLETRQGVYITGRSVKGARMRVFWPCQDGYICFIIYGGTAGRRTNQALVSWMEEKGVDPGVLRHIDWDNFDITQVTQDEIDRMEEPIGRFFLGLSKREFLEGGARRGMLGYPVATARDIFEDPQLQARGFWQEVEHAGLAARLVYPGPFARFSRWQARIRRPAPRLGEHNEAIYVEELGLSRDELHALREAGVI